MKKDLELDSVAITDGPVINKDGMTFVNTDGTPNTTAPSIGVGGINGGGTKITNIADGTEAGDAVNFGQLEATVNAATAEAKTEVKAGTNIISVDESTAEDDHTVYTVNAKDTALESGSISYDEAGNGILTLVNQEGDTTSNVIVTGMKDTFVKEGDTTYDEKGNATVTLTNNDGSTATLAGVKNNYTTGGNLENNVLTFERNDGATYSIEGVASMDDIEILGNGINQLSGNIADVGAHSAALAALHPLDFDSDDKWSAAAGYGHYKGANSVAIGAFYRPNEDTMVSVGGFFGDGENLINAGVSLKFGRSSGVTNSCVAMAKEITALKSKVDNLVVQNEKLMGLINHLAGQPTKVNADFADVPRDHWAYGYVKTLAEKGLLKGYFDGEFKGDRPMTRYEFAAVIFRALQQGAEVDSAMGRAMSEFGPQLEKVQQANLFRVDRVAGKDSDRHKIERVRVNNKNAKKEGGYKDMYGTQIVE